MNESPSLYHGPRGEGYLEHHLLNSHNVSTLCETPRLRDLIWCSSCEVITIITSIWLECFVNHTGLQRNSFTP